MELQGILSFLGGAGQGYVQQSQRNIENQHQQDQLDMEKSNSSDAKARQYALDSQNRVNNARPIFNGLVQDPGFKARPVKEQHDLLHAQFVTGKQGGLSEDEFGQLVMDTGTPPASRPVPVLGGQVPSGNVPQDNGQSAFAPLSAQMSSPPPRIVQPQISTNAALSSPPNNNKSTAAVLHNTQPPQPAAAVQAQGPPQLSYPTSNGTRMQGAPSESYPQVTPTQPAAQPTSTAAIMQQAVPQGQSQGQIVPQGQSQVTQPTAPVPQQGVPPQAAQGQATNANVPEKDNWIYSGVTSPDTGFRETLDKAVLSKTPSYALKEYLNNHPEMSDDTKKIAQEDIATTEDAEAQHQATIEKIYGLKTATSIARNYQKTLNQWEKEGPLAQENYKNRMDLLHAFVDNKDTDDDTKKEAQNSIDEMSQIDPSTLPHDAAQQRINEKRQNDQANINLKTLSEKDRVANEKEVNKLRSQGLAIENGHLDLDKTKWNVSVDNPSSRYYVPKQTSSPNTLQRLESAHQKQLRDIAQFSATKSNGPPDKYGNATTVPVHSGPYAQAYISALQAAEKETNDKIYALRNGESVQPSIDKSNPQTHKFTSTMRSSGSGGKYSSVPTSDLLKMLVQRASKHK